MVRIPLSHHATSSPSASLKCNHAKVPRQVRCLGKERLVLLVLDPVVVSPWEAEGEAGSPDHLALEETASLVL